jgi:ABC-type nickel/cobalt efflux system permease component RcnA
VSAILLLGFLLGLRHALESDHVAAVATLVARRRSFGRTLLQGLVWGLGHALTLFIACAAVLYLDALVPERVAQALEALVGAMLIVLGIDVLRRLWRERIHFHTHRHGDGTAHLHAHSHRGDTAHDPADHRHVHRGGFPVRALGVGMIHGLAGSAALILLSLDSTSSPATGLLYVAVFGLGATAGMAVLSVVIAIPLSWSARGASWLHYILQGIVGAITIGVGSLLLYENFAEAGFL